MTPENKSKIPTQPTQPQRRGIIEETPEEWGMSYYFGIEVTQEQLDARRTEEEERKSKKGGKKNNI